MADAYPTAVRRIGDVNFEADSRQRILDAALEELHAKGILGLRIADVAAKAGVSQSAIYKFYRDRDGLLAKVLGDLLRSFHESDAAAIREFLNNAPDPLDPGDLAVLFTHPSREDRKWRRWMRMNCFVAASEIPALWSELGRSQGEFIDQIEQVAIEVRARTGAVGPFESRAFALAVASNLFGLVYNDVIDEKISDDSYFAFMREFLRHNLS